MTERKPVFNPQTVTSKKRLQKKGQSKNKGLALFQRKKRQTQVHERYALRHEPHKVSYRSCFLASFW